MDLQNLDTPALQTLIEEAQRQEPMAAARKECRG